MIQPEGLQQGWSDSSATIHLKMQFPKVRPFSQSKGNKNIGLNFLPFSSAVSTLNDRKKIASVVTVSTPN